MDTIASLVRLVRHAMERGRIAATVAREGSVPKAGVRRAATAIAVRHMQLEPNAAMNIAMRAKGWRRVETRIAANVTVSITVRADVTVKRRPGRMARNGARGGAPGNILGHMGNAARASNVLSHRSRGAIGAAVAKRPNHVEKAREASVRTVIGPPAKGQAMVDIVVKGASHKTPAVRARIVTMRAERMVAANNAAVTVKAGDACSARLSKSYQ
jgi:hypothetical protein